MYSLYGDLPAPKAGGSDATPNTESGKRAAAAQPTPPQHEDDANILSATARPSTASNSSAQTSSAEASTSKHDHARPPTGVWSGSMTKLFKPSTARRRHQSLSSTPAVAASRSAPIVAAKAAAPDEPAAQAPSRPALPLQPTETTSIAKPAAPTSTPEAEQRSETLVSHLKDEYDPLHPNDYENVVEERQRSRAREREEQQRERKRGQLSRKEDDDHSNRRYSPPQRRSRGRMRSDSRDRSRSRSPSGSSSYSRDDSRSRSRSRSDFDSDSRSYSRSSSRSRSYSRSRSRSYSRSSDESDGRYSDEQYRRRRRRRERYDSPARDEYRGHSRSQPGEQRSPAAPPTALPPTPPPPPPPPPVDGDPRAKLRVSGEEAFLRRAQLQSSSAPRAAFEPRFGAPPRTNNREDVSAQWRVPSDKLPSRRAHAGSSPPPPRPLEAGGTDGDAGGAGGGGAAQLMEKMGWKEGHGLGKDSQGIVRALEVSREPPTRARAGKDDGRPAAAAAPPRGRKVNPVSRVLLLTNMVGRGQVDAGLEQETAEECSKYGRVERCAVHEVTDASVRDEYAVRIFIKFAEHSSASRALLDLDGRFFGGRVVKATYFPQHYFDSGRLALGDIDNE